MSARHRLLLASGLVLCAGPLAAQQDTTRTTTGTPNDTARRHTTLAPVQITVTRERARSPLDVPYAITSTRPDSARPGERNLALDETLLLLPGVTVANRYNPSQDPRISIRGFGSRATFGVRGVRILRDGIPLTLPDGQTPVDYLDLETVGSVQAIRGTASALYGNAAGGVIDLRSAPAPTEPAALSIRGWTGSFDTDRLVGSFGGTVHPPAIGGLSYQGDIARTTTNGWRQFSQQSVTSGFSRITSTIAGTDLALEAMLFDEPVAQNPGDLTAAQLAQNPAQADPLSIRKKARKSVHQGQIGLTAARSIGTIGDAPESADVTAMLYGGWRALENPTTFAIIDVHRLSGGGSARATLPFMLFGLLHRASIGVDVQRVRDDRHEWTNCNDTIVAPVSVSCPLPRVERGSSTKNQIESVWSVGPFARLEARVAPSVWIDAGVRADRVKFRVDDRLITATNPDDSGDPPALSAVSPMAGVSWRVTPLTALYANVTTAFETPTVTELVNKPDGTTGLNPDLKPQHATTLEAGTKGLVAVGSGIEYDVALFDTRVRDELIPFEIPGSNGRRYFRNAGRTERRGVELGANADVGPFRLGLSGSYSDFRFKEFHVDTGGKHLDFAGNRIPGIPIQQAQASMTWHRRDLFVTVEGIVQGSIFVDDANSARSSGYQIANLRLGSTGFFRGRRVGSSGFGYPWLSPVVGIQNLFDRRYVSSVSVNASGGKYYEPAPGRTLFVGLTVGDATGTPGAGAAP